MIISVMQRTGLNTGIRKISHLAQLALTYLCLYIKRGCNMLKTQHRPSSVIIGWNMDSHWLSTAPKLQPITKAVQGWDI